jgi:transposase
VECLNRKIPFRLLNPVMTKQFTRATVRKMKTDRSDALIIAKLALQGEGTPITTATFASAKSISRTAVKLNQMIQMLTLMQERFAASLPG